jgi:choline dehydrogenase-like flavoprotein
VVPGVTLAGTGEPAHHPQWGKARPRPAHAEDRRSTAPLAPGRRHTPPDPLRPPWVMHRRHTRWTVEVPPAPRWRRHCARRPPLRCHRHRNGCRRRHPLPPARPFGQAGPVARARRLPAARARQLGLHRRVREGEVPGPGVLAGPARRGVPPEVNYYVGGNTKFYGAALFRLRPQDFGELRHHGGLSPAWPIGYADLEPYYTQAEHLYQVHGRHGEDPTAGDASADYLHPPVAH